MRPEHKSLLDTTLPSRAHQFVTQSYVTDANITHDCVSQTEKRAKRGLARPRSISQVVSGPDPGPRDKPPIVYYIIVRLAPRADRKPSSRSLHNRSI